MGGDLDGAAVGAGEVLGGDDEESEEEGHDGGGDAAVGGADAGAVAGEGHRDDGGAGEHDEDDDGDVVAQGGQALFGDVVGLVEGLDVAVDRQGLGGGGGVGDSALPQGGEHSVGPLHVGGEFLLVGGDAEFEAELGVLAQEVERGGLAVSAGSIRAKLAVLPIALASSSTTARRRS